MKTIDPVCGMTIDQVLILRDATGEPIWAGWKKIEKKK
jgi:hypothetical protein